MQRYIRYIVLGFASYIDAFSVFEFVLKISSSQLSASTFYVVAETLAYRCRNTEFFQFMQKRFRCVYVRCDVIAFFDLVQANKVDVRGKTFGKPCKFGCASVGVVFALNERVLEDDASSCLFKVVFCRRYEFRNGKRLVYGHKSTSQLVKRSVQTHRQRNFVTAIGKLAQFVAKSRRR